MKKTVNILIIFVLIMIFMIAFIGCRQADIVSRNISLQADSFNITRQLTAINTRTDTMIFVAKGNFSITKEADGDLAIIGENPDGTTYKHFVFLNGDVTYICEDISSSNVSKYTYEINFNPRLIFEPIKAVIVD